MYFSMKAKNWKHSFLDENEIFYSNVSAAGAYFPSSVKSQDSERLICTGVHYLLILENIHGSDLSSLFPLPTSLSQEVLHICRLKWHRGNERGRITDKTEENSLDLLLNLSNEENYHTAVQISFFLFFLQYKIGAFGKL